MLSGVVYGGRTAPFLLAMPILVASAFLLASVWHFGTEDTCDGGLPALAWGGLPIAVPVLLQPAATVRILSAVSGLALDGIPPWLFACSLAWLIPLSVVVVRSRGRNLALPATTFAGFAILPPLTAFALYFVAAHALAHTAALISHPQRAPRVRDALTAWQLALPTTVLTVAIGAALWPFYSGPTLVRLLCLTLQMLAGLTLPHTMLEAWLNRKDPIHNFYSMVYPPRRTFDRVMH